MKWPLFENKIKDDLSAHRSEVDVDALWSAIEPEVDAINKSRKKKRRGILWFWLAGGLLLISSAAFLFLKNNENEKTAIVKNEAIANGNLNNSGEKQAVLKKENDTELNTNKEDNVLNNSNKNDFTQKLNNENSGPKNNFNKNKKQSFKKVENKISDNHFAKNENASVNVFNNNNNVLTDGKENAEFSKNKNGENYLPDNFDENIEVLSAVKNMEKILLLPISLIQNEQNVLAKINTIFKKRAIAENNKKTIEQIESIPPSNRKKLKYSIALNGGISYANRSLSGNDTLIALRENTERQQETSHLGLQMTAQHESGFSVSTGLQYTRMVELYERNGTVVTEDSIDGIALLYVNPNNDTIPVMGRVPHKTTYVLKKKYFNKYTLFDVPVIIGYTSKKGDWEYGAQAGVFANISLKTEGRFLKNKIDDEDIKGLFKSTIGLSYYLGGSINYQLNENIKIGVKPYMRYFPKNFAKDTYGVSQKYILYGVGAKVVYVF